MHDSPLALGCGHAFAGGVNRMGTAVHIRFFQLQGAKRGQSIEQLGGWPVRERAWSSRPQISCIKRFLDMAIELFEFVLWCQILNLLLFVIKPTNKLLVRL